MSRLEKALFQQSAESRTRPAFASSGPLILFWLKIEGGEAIVRDLRLARKAQRKVL
jgi:hypothetical protein